MNLLKEIRYHIMSQMPFSIISEIVPGKAQPIRCYIVKAEKAFIHNDSGAAFNKHAGGHNLLNFPQLDPESVVFYLIITPSMELYLIVLRDTGIISRLIGAHSPKIYKGGCCPSRQIFVTQTHAFSADQKFTDLSLLYLLVRLVDDITGYVP